MSIDADEEARLVELVSWLEKAGHEGDALQNLAELIDGKRKSCRKTSLRRKSCGVEEVCFWFPLAELKKVCPINDESQLANWLDAINTDGIEAALVDDEKMGKCVLITRLRHIPPDQREA